MGFGVGAFLILVIVAIVFFDLWEFVMNSFGASLVVGILTYMTLPAPWDFIIPVIVGVLWVIYKLGGFDNRGGRGGGDWFDSDGGGDGGGD